MVPKTMLFGSQNRSKIVSFFDDLFRCFLDGQAAISVPCWICTGPRIDSGSRFSSLNFDAQKKGDILKMCTAPRREYDNTHVLHATKTHNFQNKHGASARRAFSETKAAKLNQTGGALIPRCCFCSQPCKSNPRAAPGLLKLPKK